MARAILDVDTGVDDALALALAVAHPEVQLEAVISVAGNVPLELTTRNSLKVLDWLGATSVAVHAGASAPLSGAVREASHWHGTDGLGGARLPDSTRTAPSDGVDYVCDRILAEPGALTLVCTGPLTNLALALRRAPEIADRVGEIVLMGGAARVPGNVTPVAEFNIYADPEAAAEVFAERWPITMVGLDVTEQVRFTRSDLTAVSAVGSPSAVLVREVCRHVFDVQGAESMALHDPLAMMVAIQPDLVETLARDVDVETRADVSLGQTVGDWRPSAPSPARRTRVCVAVDADRARELFFATLRISLPG